MKELKTRLEPKKVRPQACMYFMENMSHSFLPLRATNTIRNWIVPTGSM